ncbi:MAG: protein-methionine-sulfoxide reductase heme-binding subunit MsrQ [Burkholderiales bacterium]
MSTATTTRAAVAPPRRAKAVLLRPWAKPLLFTLCLLPFACLLYGVIQSTMGGNALGANPAEKLIRATGDWTLRFLCITLAVTPLRQLARQPALARFRRMLGLFAFFYGCLHFMCYSWLDMGLVWDDIVHDIAKRPFILVGSSALLLMSPLALTSFNRAIKALDPARWQALHRAVYAVALLGLLHFFWMRSAKRNFAEVAIYAVVIALLLGWRVVRRLRA